MTKLRYRFIIGFVALILCCVFLIGCAAKRATMLERMSDNINTVNRVSNKIYLYKYESELLSENLNSVETITSLDELKFQNDFVMMAVPKEYYDDVDHEFISHVLDLLGNYSQKFYVAFLGFPDLNFLKDTMFNSEKDHYPAYNFLCGFHNFNLEIKQSGGGVEIIENGEVVTPNYDENMIAGFAQLIQEYNQAQ